MLTADALTALAQKGLDAFVAELSEWVLLGDLREVPQGGWAYQTGRVTRPSAGANAQSQFLSADWSVLPLVKRPGVPFAGVVLLGRSSNNDLVIGHTSISKLHARFRVRDGKLFVEDAVSSNGIKLNGGKLAPEIESGLDHGDLLEMGDLTLHVASTRNLFAHLKSR